MPLLDHFRAPLSQDRRWEGFHSAWAEAMASHLNHDLLPQQYYADANIKVGKQVEIDVATREEQNLTGNGKGGVAVWAPAKPQAVVALDFSQLDEFEVLIINDEAGPRVVAAIELISPANKDRPLHRRMFAAKCASYLQQGIGVIVVDVVTVRSGNLQRELSDLLGVTVDVPGKAASELYAAAYRAGFAETESMQMEIWSDMLKVGSSLPTLPLWIAPDRCVPLDLEKTYRTACANRRIAL
jgi:hypothetical protein